MDKGLEAAAAAAAMETAHFADQLTEQLRTLADHLDDLSTCEAEQTHSQLLPAIALDYFRFRRLSQDGDRLAVEIRSVLELADDLA